MDLGSIRGFPVFFMFSFPYWFCMIQLGVGGWTWNSQIYLPLTYCIYVSSFKSIHCVSREINSIEVLVFLAGAARMPLTDSVVPPCRHRINRCFLCFSRKCCPHDGALSLALNQSVPLASLSPSVSSLCKYRRLIWYCLVHPIKSIGATGCAVVVWPLLESALPTCNHQINWC